ncbi:MAG: hypothetical protein A2W33_03385 [Chloroflexi bacterium RBG_16_52_11]|nr:MAG: hypothetical protein A2W33_03385 [Chloroflexi bacterium RBG_16_52_11]
MSDVKEAQPIEEETQPGSGRRRGGLVLSFAVILALLGLLAWGLKKAQAGPLDNGLAPDFTITGFDGRTVTLNQLRQNLMRRAKHLL